MIDLIIKLIIVLGLQFGYNSDGKITMSEQDVIVLKSSNEYLEAGSPDTKDIQIVNSNLEEDIVVVPEVDPAYVK